MSVLLRLVAVATLGLGVLGATPALAREGTAVVQNERDRGDLPDRDLPDRDLPDRDLPDRDLPDGDLSDRDLPGNRDLPGDRDLPDHDLPSGGAPRR